jgi:RNA polymerase sigma-70 factor (ECF subfamily)
VSVRITNLSDFGLAERAVRGDATAAEELVRRALPVVRGLGRRLTGDAEDGDALAQDAIVAALEGLERYRGDAAFSTWVCAIAIRRHADEQRRRRSERRLAERMSARRPIEPKMAINGDTATRLWALVTELPAAHRDALVARATSGSNAEAAGRMGITPGAMRVRLHRARLALRAALTARCPDLLEEVGYAPR